MKEDSSMHLLDLGCGLGQNMRKLLVDGVPAAQLAGADVSAGLIACGHEYFRDADRWQCEMYIGNLFDAQARINHEASGRYDVIWAAMVYHLWAWDGQLKACIQTARLMKEKPGSFLFGWQLGATPAVVQKKLSLGWRRGTYINMFRHDEESFRKLWKEVTHETGIDFDVTTKVHFPDWIRGRDELEGSKGSVIAFKVARR
jgi:SAM-dependent methyltransferase